MPELRSSDENHDKWNRGCWLEPELVTLSLLIRFLALVVLEDVHKVRNEIFDEENSLHVIQCFCMLYLCYPCKRNNFCGKI